MSDQQTDQNDFIDRPSLNSTSRTNNDQQQNLDILNMQRNTESELRPCLESYIESENTKLRVMLDSVNSK